AYQTGLLMHGCAAHGRSLLKARSPPRLSIVSIIQQFASKAHEKTPFLYDFFTFRYIPRIIGPTASIPMRMSGKRNAGTGCGVSGMDALDGASLCAVCHKHLLA